MTETRRKNPAWIMWVTLLLFLGGVALLAIDFSLRAEPAKSTLMPGGQLGYAGMAVAALAILWWLIVLLTCRCPSCGAWIHPWHYPRPGHYCPQCGDGWSR